MDLASGKERKINLRDQRHSDVGIIFLGLLAVLTIFVLRQKQERGQQAKLPSTKEKSSLTVSDWVTYLTSEKFGIMGAVLNVSAVLIALVALIYSANTTHTLWEAISSGVVVIALATYLLMKIFRPFERRGKLAESILKKVMSGELKSEESIRKEWLDGQKSKKAE